MDDTDGQGRVMDGDMRAPAERGEAGPSAPLEVRWMRNQPMGEVVVVGDKGYRVGLSIDFRRVVVFVDEGIAMVELAEVARLVIEGVMREGSDT